MNDQPPLQISSGGQHHNLSFSPSSQHTPAPSATPLAAKATSSKQAPLPPSGGSGASEGDSFCCDADDYVDLRSRSRSRGQSRDTRKKSKSSQSQYLAKQASASPSPCRGDEGHRRCNDTVRVENSTVSRPRKREDRRREDALAASFSAGPLAANESRKTTTNSNSGPYWPSPLRGNDYLEPIAAAGMYQDTWKQQQRQERRERLRVEGGT